MKEVVLDPQPDGEPAPGSTVGDKETASLSSARRKTVEVKGADKLWSDVSGHCKQPAGERGRVSSELTELLRRGCLRGETQSR